MAAGAPRGTKHFHKKTLRTLFKKSLKVLACLIILKDITKDHKKSQKVWAVYKQSIPDTKFPYSNIHYESLFVFPNYPGNINIIQTLYTFL